MTEARPSLETALRTVREAIARLAQDQPEAALRATDDDLLAQLPQGWADPEGRIELDDGSQLYITPEMGDRNDPMPGRIGVVQLFRDGRPEMIHLITS